MKEGRGGGRRRRLAQGSTLPSPLSSPEHVESEEFHSLGAFEYVPQKFSECAA